MKISFLFTELRKNPGLRPGPWLLTVGAALVLAGITAFSILQFLAARVDPQVAAVPTSPLVLDRNGRLLRAFTVANGRWRLPVTLEDVDPLFIRMLLAF